MLINAPSKGLLIDIVHINNVVELRINEDIDVHEALVRLRLH